MATRYSLMGSLQVCVQEPLFACVSNYYVDEVHLSRNLLNC